MRKLLRPGWLLLHVVVLCVIATMVGLGWWQWSRARDTGSIRYYSYCVEWYAFALLTVIGYAKICYDETKADPDEGLLSGAVMAAAPDPAAELVLARQWEQDPELAAWNARFRDLAEQDAAKQRAAQQRVEGPATTGQLGRR